MKRKPFLTIFVVLVISLLVALQFNEVCAAPLKSPVPQVLPGSVYPSRAYAINERGEAVGYSNNTWWYKKAVKWTADGEMIDLGFLPGTNMSVANGINNRGDVVGYCGQYITLLGGGIVDMNYRATMWTVEGEIMNLGTLPGAESIALSINNQREVVGQTYLRWIERFQDSDGNVREMSVRQGYRGWYWNVRDGMRDLGAFPGGNSSIAYDINDRGQIVGAAGNGTGRSGTSQAAMWTRNGVIVGLGILPGGRYSGAYGINDRGQVVGYSSTSTTSQAFLWTAKDGIEPLETLPGHTSFAMGINDNGQIVGYSYLSYSWYAIYNASLWTPKGDLVELEPLPGRTSQALCINNRGQIVGASYFADPNYSTVGDAVIWENWNNQ